MNVPLIIYGRWHLWGMSNYLSRVILCKLSSHLTSHLQLTLQVTWHGFLQFTNDAIYVYGSALIYVRDRIKHLEYTHSYTRGYANNTSHVVIRSMCAQLPFVSISNNTCWSVVTVLGYITLLWLLDWSCLIWRAVFHLVLQVCTCTPWVLWFWKETHNNHARAYP